MTQTVGVCHAPGSNAVRHWFTQPHLRVIPVLCHQPPVTRGKKDFYMKNCAAVLNQRSTRPDISADNAHNSSTISEPGCDICSVPLSCLLLYLKQLSHTLAQGCKDLSCASRPPPSTSPTPDSRQPRPDNPEVKSS